MASTAGLRRASGRWLAALFWPAYTVPDLKFILASMPVQVAAPAIAVILWLTTAGAGAGFLPGQLTPLILILTVCALVLTVAALPALTQAQRHLMHVMRGVHLPPPPAARRTTWRGLLAWLRAGTTWRQLAYHVLVAPVLALAGLLMPFLWATGVTLAAIFAYVGLLKSFNLKFIEPGHTVVYGYLTVLGVLALLAAPRAGAAVIRLDIRVARALLGPSRITALEHRVETLTESRAGVVDAADAERRRIERDLHDGAQQRLVSLAMNLGLARAELSGLPEDARRVIAEAHDEAKEALAELRHLVRGLHPAILEDRGFDAALSGVVARSPVPVRLDVRVPERAPPTVEAVAYFVVSEALANVAKHAGAAHAEVRARRNGGVLWVTVTDDGTGGADPSRGTGLAGLAHRVRSVDGTLSISSPAGGPTTITAELPCAW
jgi:signal transduction histidine kinase